MRLEELQDNISQIKTVDDSSKKAILNLIDQKTDNDMKAVINAIEGLRTEIAGTRAEIASIEKGLRTEIAGVEKGLKSEITNTKWMVGVLIAVLIIPILKLLFFNEPPNCLNY